MQRAMTAAAAVAIGSTALLHARTVAALVAATLLPSAETLAASGRRGDTTAARASAHGGHGQRSADALLARNPFDHVTGSLGGRSDATGQEVASSAALRACTGVRALVTLRGEDEGGSLAALDVAGRRVVRGTGGEVEGARVLAIGFDRVWLAREGGTCVAAVFTTTDAPAPAPPPPPATSSAAVDPRIRAGVVRVAPGEVHVDRAALEALSESLPNGKLRAVPERVGDRMVGLRLGRIEPSSAMGLLGFESGDRIEAIAGIELSDTSALLEGWARLRAGAEGRVPVRVVRAGKTTQLDFVVR